MTPHDSARSNRMSSHDPKIRVDLAGLAGGSLNPTAPRQSICHPAVMDRDVRLAVTVALGLAFCLLGGALLNPLGAVFVGVLIGGATWLVLGQLKRL
jgi:hypothetical protein